MHYCPIFLALAYLDVQASTKDVFDVECRDGAQSLAFVFTYMAHLVASGCQFGVFPCFAACLNTRSAMIRLFFPSFALSFVISALFFTRTAIRAESITLRPCICTTPTAPSFQNSCLAEHCPTKILQGTMNSFITGVAQHYLSRTDLGDHTLTNCIDAGTSHSIRTGFGDQTPMKACVPTVACGLSPVNDDQTSSSRLTSDLKAVRLASIKTAAKVL